MGGGAVTKALAFSIVLGIIGAPVGEGCGHLRAAERPGDDPPGVAIRQERLAEFHAELTRRIAAAPDRAMTGRGLAGALGGTRVRVLAEAPQEILLPIPQLIEGQVPVCYFVGTTPPDAVTGFRLWEREGGNVVLRVQIAGKRQEVAIEWSAVVLMAPRPDTPDRTAAEPYRVATPCAQADAEEMTKLAAELWPPTGTVDEFAANIQRHVRAMKRETQPRSLDALAILRSGENGICTANANLACALMRSKGIACRSVAVIPPVAMKLEMHRIAEYRDGERWLAFDPSSLQVDIPAKPWQNIVMARTTVPDEGSAMVPRMGVMRGGPYGQEIELLTPGVNLFGQDFFWTIAKPLAEFEPTDESTRSARGAWARFLDTGTLSPIQIDAGFATTGTEFADRWKAR